MTIDELFHEDARTRNTLKKAQIKTLDQLLALAESDFLQIRYAGRKMLCEIRECLAERGIKWPRERSRPAAAAMWRPAGVDMQSDHDAKDVHAGDEGSCAALLDRLEDEVRLTLERCTPVEDGPRFTRMLAFSVLMRLGSRLGSEALEEFPDDRPRYVATVHEVERRLITPGAMLRAH